MTADTTGWLPPNDQLAAAWWSGHRWAPAKDYHLGTVKKVDGRKVTVVRMADKADVVVDLATLRAGAIGSAAR